MEKLFDNFDELMRAAAKEENSSVYFDALLADVKQAKAAGDRAARGRMRLLSSAAAIVLVVGGAAVWASGTGMFTADDVAPMARVEDMETVSATQFEDVEANGLYAVEPEGVPGDGMLGFAAGGEDSGNGPEGCELDGLPALPTDGEFIFIGKSANSTLVPNSLPATVQNVFFICSGAEYVFEDGSVYVSALTADGSIAAGWALAAETDGGADMLYAPNDDTLIRVYSDSVDIETLKELLKGW